MKHQFCYCLTESIWTLTFLTANFCVSLSHQCNTTVSLEINPLTMWNRQKNFQATKCSPQRQSIFLDFSRILESIFLVNSFRVLITIRKWKACWLNQQAKQRTWTRHYSGQVQLVVRVDPGITGFQVPCPYLYVPLCHLTILSHWKQRILNLGTMTGRYKTQVTGHRSLFYQYRKYPKHLWKLTLVLIRPKKKFVRPRVSF